ncbi:hypothetical protein TSOC_013503, partial [Tetrabaena socialis]
MAAGPGGVSAQRMVQLGQEVAAVRGESDSLREGLERLTQQVAALKAGLGTSAAESLGRLQTVEEGVGALQASVAELVIARREAAGRQAGEVSFADFSMLRSQVDAAVAEARGHGAAVAALAERELPALAARVEEVVEGMRKSGEPRDMDTLFHERINGLEAGMGDLQTEFRASIESALEGAAKVEELQALEEVVEGKAALDAVRLLQMQAHALGQAVAGMSDSLALRPELGETLRSLAAGSPGGGPMATRTKCLTCDQPAARSAPSLGSAEGRAGKGSFLPRLDSMPVKESGPPGGPGLMIAEHRAHKEERMAGQRGAGGGGGA